MSLLADTFDTNSEGYNRYRPSYSLSIRDEILERTAVTEHARILEIGSGTGQATGFFKALNPI